MIYATYQDAVDLYGADYAIVAFDKDLDGAADVDVYTGAFNRSNAEIDGMLVGNVPLPLDSVPPDLRAYAIDIAIYYGSMTCDVLTQQKKDLFKQAREAVQSIAKNLRKLGQETPNENYPMSAEIESDERVFSKSTLGRVF